MASLLIVSGPPGAGKSTLAAALAGELPRSVLVSGDQFFRFLATGAIEPWSLESAEQNHVVTEAAAWVQRRSRNPQDARRVHLGHHRPSTCAGRDA
jgi:adenylate kinase family enzyme